MTKTETDDSEIQQLWASRIHWKKTEYVEGILVVQNWRHWQIRLEITRLRGNIMLDKLMDPIQQ
jgi:hypothetical protein